VIVNLVPPLELPREGKTLSMPVKKLQGNIKLYNDREISLKKMLCLSY